MATIDTYAIRIDTQQAENALGSLKGAAGGLRTILSALAAVLGTRELIAYTSQWTDLNSRLKNSIGSARQAEEALKQISQTARTTFSSLSATADAFLRNSRTLQELGLTTQQQIDLSDSLNNALAISGTKGAQAESVMNALSKAFATGKLSGDNFNSVIENGGRITQALADGLGVTTLELRALAAAGKLETLVVIEALTSQMEKLRKEAGDMPVTARDGFILLNNAIFEFVGRLDTALGSSANFGELIQQIADAITSLARDTEQMVKLAIVITEVTKAIAELIKVIAGLALLGFSFKIAAAFKAVALSVGPAIAAVKALFSGLKLLPKALNTPLTRTNIIATLQTVPGIGQKASVVFRALGGVVDGLGKALATVGLTSLAAFLGFKAYSNIQDQFAEATQGANSVLQDSHVLLFEQKQAADAAREAFEKLKAIEFAKELEEVNRQLEKGTRGYQDQIASVEKELQLQLQLIGATQQQRTEAEALNRAEIAFSKERRRIQDAIAEAERSNKASEKAGIVLLQKQLQDLDKSYATHAGNIKKLTEQTHIASRTFATGFKQAFNEFVDDATNAAAGAKRAFETFTRATEDLLFNFFKTGKFGFKDFLQTIIDELLRSQIRQLIAKTFTMPNMSGGGGGRGGLLGGSIIPGFLATGGMANANKPYIVGERGPELFIPRSTGTVVPNNELGMGSGASVTYNINAVDAPSFKQMIAQDPSFLFAVSEQGRRRLPGGRA